MSSERGRPSLAARVRSSAYVAVHAPLEARFPFRPPAAIERTKQRRLRKTVEFAWREVPYYTETMRRLDLTPSDIRTEGDLAKLPIVEPEQLQRDPEYFVSRTHPKERCIEIHTSGSSGAPRTYFRDIASVARDAVHFTRLLAIVKRLAGKRVRLSQASIVPPVSSTTATVQDAYRALSLFPSRAGVQRTRLSLLDPLHESIARLNELKPDVIFTFGSYLEALFIHADETGEPLHRPAAVIYSADPLSSSVRRLISEKFGIQVLSTYSATEMPQIGFECELHSGLHVNTDLHPLRIVDSNGRKATAGESGDVVVSNLVNQATVLLNYRLGDIASELPHRCGCGRNLPLISFPEGRSDDWLLTRSGRLIHSRAATMWLEQVQGIFRYQLVQEAAGRFRIVLVPAPNCDREAIRTDLMHRFRETFGKGTTLAVSFSDSLPRTEGGKVKPIISMVRPQAAPRRAPYSA